ncbi:MAG: outer membrane beta-barrel protein [Alphaproteobacteria bacterium]|nr:outer membrane beta-barrel protein [Alphaproteobacteria bacterium]
MRLFIRSFATIALATATFIGSVAAPTNDAQAQYTGKSTADYFPTWYVGMRGSINTLRGSDLGTSPLPETDYDPGFALGASVGVNMPRAFFQPLGGLSFEAEISRYWQKIDNNRIDFFFPLMIASEGERDFDVTAYMLNAYWKIPTNTMFTPYIGGGIGTADVQLQSDPVAPMVGDDEDTVAAWQAMVGLSFEEDPRSLTQWHLGYRYFTTDDPEFDDGFGGKTIIENDIHSVEAGVRFRF